MRQNGDLKARKAESFARAYCPGSPAIQRCTWIRTPRKAPVYRGHPRVKGPHRGLHGGRERCDAAVPTLAPAPGDGQIMERVTSSLSTKVPEKNRLSNLVSPTKTWADERNGGGKDMHEATTEAQTVFMSEQVGLGPFVGSGNGWRSRGGEGRDHSQLALQEDGPVAEDVADKPGGSSSADTLRAHVIDRVGSGSGQWRKLSCIAGSR
ncbi:hypothetical protein LZ30DRAFT_687907 [Colletotrichum cereale]|nr:hypothetical protein LZ30DRAFT_687907 [Colletotrichum cereale]